MKRRVAPFTLITALSLIGPSGAMAAGEPEKGAQVFKAKCAICHTVEAGNSGSMEDRAGGSNLLGPRYDRLADRHLQP